MMITNPILVHEKNLVLVHDKNYLHTQQHQALWQVHENHIYIDAFLNISTATKWKFLPSPSNSYTVNMKNFWIFCHIEPCLKKTWQLEHESINTSLDYINTKKYKIYKKWINVPYKKFYQTQHSKRNKKQLTQDFT